jgi:hypothetical protein
MAGTCLQCCEDMSLTSACVLCLIVPKVTTISAKVTKGPANLSRVILGVTNVRGRSETIEDAHAQ